MNSTRLHDIYLEISKHPLDLQDYGVIDDIKFDPWSTINVENTY